MKRNLAALHGRWNSVSQSVEPEGKGKRHAEKQVQCARSASPEPHGQSHPTAVNTNTMLNTYASIYPPPGPPGPQDAGTS